MFNRIKNLADKKETHVFIVRIVLLKLLFVKYACQMAALNWKCRKSPYQFGRGICVADSFTSGS